MEEPYRIAKPGALRDPCAPALVAVRPARQQLLRLQKLPQLDIMLV